MADIDFYSYMYGTVCPTFDELAESVDLSDADSVNKAFAAYVIENAPPFGLKESLMEEKFYMSEDDGDKGDETILRYDMEIPGIDEDAEAADIKRWFEEFLDRIRAEDGAGGNRAVVEVDVRDNERGGTDCDIYVAVHGEQVVPKETKEKE